MTTTADLKNQLTTEAREIHEELITLVFEQPELSQKRRKLERDRDFNAAAAVNNQYVANHERIQYLDSQLAQHDGAYDLHGTILAAVKAERRAARQAARAAAN